MDRRTIGTGETVPTAFVQRQCRALFINALNRLVPSLTTDLLTNELVRLVDEANRCRSAWSETHPSLPPAIQRDIEGREETPEYRNLELANQAVADYIRTWQERHRLTDDWLFDAACSTVRRAQVEGPRDALLVPSPEPLVLGDDELSDTRHADKALYAIADPSDPDGTFYLTPDHTKIDVPVFLDMLKYPSELWYDESGEAIGEMEDDGMFSTFDPRTESIPTATNRLLNELKPRVCSMLEAIVADDRNLNNALSPVSYRTLKSFEWLVRYQVSGESIRAISRAEPTDATHVSREVRRAAGLVGLTLRPSERKGRPRKPRARTVKV